MGRRRLHRGLRGTLLSGDNKCMDVDKRERINALKVVLCGTGKRCVWGGWGEGEGGCGKQETNVE